MAAASKNGQPDALRPAHPLSFFDPEQVERPTPGRPWRMMAIAAAVATALLTLAWELYWRSQWHEVGDFKNTAALWAQERRKAVGDATVLLGSSRIFFGADLNVWERTVGERPIQLAIEGTSPRSFLEDLANDEKFRGLAIVDYTGPNFITKGGRRADVIEYVRDQSPSERIDHWLSTFLERGFAFIDEQTRPRRMMSLAPLPARRGQMERIDPRKMMVVGEDRNAELWARVVEDEPYRARSKRIWKAINDRLRRRMAPGGPLAKALSDEEIDNVLAELKRNVGKIRARGGDVAFVRFPIEGDYVELEREFFPRSRFWDRMVAETGSAGINFEDYKELQGFELPEWSHLEPREAERYTAALTPILYNEINRKAAERRTMVQ